jgi:hypothetical protein
MKIIPVAFAAALLALAAGCSGASPASTDDTSSSEADLKGDSCSKAALNAAEDEYGNDPMRTHVKVVEKGKRYEVTVGIGNPEDGAHEYVVTFKDGCSSTPSVYELPN